MSLYALLDPLVRAGYAVLTGIAAALPGPTTGAALAVAIALLTVALRACLLPAAIAALRADRARTALAPQIARLRRRYASDRVKLSSEITAAYRRAGISPFAGLRPALVQLVALSTMYRIIVVPTVAGHPNAILDASVLGAPLAGHWPAILAAAGPLSAPAAAFTVVIVALLTLAWLSARAAARRADQIALTSGEPQAAMMQRLMRLLPYGTAAFAVIAPVAVSLYLIATTAWTVAERAVLPHLT
jgi:YidC/Oxa1 family membrane protein insertase